MSEPSPRPAIASSPLSVLLFAQALSTETQAAVQGWRSYLDTLRRPYEILLIQETRSEAAPESPPAERIFSFERIIGFAAAWNEAIRAAQHPLLVFCPADRQYVPSELDKLLRLIDQVDLVTGYRTGGQAPPWRVMLDTILGLFSRLILGVPLEPRKCWFGSTGWGRRWVARWLFGVRVTDPECAFRLARRDVFQHLPIQSGGSFVQIEMLAKANHLSRYLAEERVSWTPPTEPIIDSISFGQDARLVFGNPDFGPYAASTSLDRQGAEGVQTAP